MTRTAPLGDRPAALARAAVGGWWVVDANPTTDPVRMFFQSSVPGGHEN